ncbi:centrosomal protein of 290 kDa-like [Rhincodon typus]|uniref:centrosomal protein of 290 kDa-like n=1 Tax=Rhincodon typus TaxID=259920 RepID=UPI00202FE500|nr:centrosomal protein of 290 kDa-like [Rhincodon typus]
MVVCVLLLVSLFAWLPAPTLSQEAVSAHRRFEYKHSFKGPHLVLQDGAIPCWTHYGNALPSSERVRVVPSMKSQSGSVWTKTNAVFENWEIEVSFRISGRSRIGADGLAIWYTRERGPTGPVYGAVDHWDGVGIFLDTYDNDGRLNNPAILVVGNDGHLTYDHLNDGGSQTLGSCFRDYRNSYHAVRIRIRYYQKTLQANDHDVLSFLTFSLTEPGTMDPSSQVPSKEQEEYQKEYERFEKDLEKRKDEFQKEHPELQTPDDEAFETEGQRELQMVAGGQWMIHDELKKLRETLDTAFEEQRRRSEHLSRMGKDERTTTARGQPEQVSGKYTECSSENQRLELLVTSLKQEITEKEQALRQIERLRKTEKTELEIKISSLELKLAEVEVLGELHQQKGPNEESEKHQSSPIRKCARCDSFMEEMSSKLQDYSARNSELQAQRETTLKSLNEVQVLTKGLQETLTFEQQLSQTLQRENHSFSKRSQEMTEQLATLVKEQEDLTKAYSKLPGNGKGNASVDYWVPRSHLVQNVVEMVKSQEEQKLHLEEENRRLKEDPGFQSFQKLEKEIQSLQQHLDAKTEKMTAMACEMEALRHKNECLMTANMKDWQQVQSLREQSHDSLIAAILGAVPRPSDGQHCNPWATHLFQELQPGHQGAREPSPCQMGGLTSPTATPRGKDGQWYSGCSLPDHGTPRAEAWFSGMSTRLNKQSKQVHSADRHSPASTQRRTPSPPRPNCPDPPLNASKSPHDFPSASESQSEDEKSQGKAMTPAMKCSLLLSPRPFRLHRSNRNKK